MRVFITGATGYVGEAVALAFARAGHSVRALARSEAAAERLSALALVPVVGDLRSPDTLGAAAGNDVIVHAAIEPGPDRLRIDRAAAGRSGDTRGVPLSEARRMLGGFADALCLDQELTARRSRALGWTARHPPFPAAAEAAFHEWAAS